jgi:DNA primase large subunit
MIFSKLDAATYPFISLASRLVKELEESLGLNAILSPDSEVLRRSVERIREAVYSRATSVYKRDLEVEVLSHPVALILIKHMNNKRLVNVYAEAEKNRVLVNLLKESQEKLATLAIDGFNWHVKREGDFLFVRFDDYLKTSVNMLDAYWKLVNRRLVKGYVELSRRDFSRLLAEAYRTRILEKVNQVEDVQVPSTLKSVIEELEREFQGVLPKVDVSATYVGEYVPSAFPACILKLLEEAEQGKNLPHMARFTLATFLLSIGKTPEELLDLFRKMPDFDESKTLYHLRHIAGEIGSRKKYTPPSCATLRTFGLCVANDELCQKVKHPLTYYSKKLKSLKRGELGKRAK